MLSVESYVKVIEVFTFDCRLLILSFSYLHTISDARCG